MLPSTRTSQHIIKANYKVKQHHNTTSVTVKASFRLQATAYSHERNEKKVVAHGRNQKLSQAAARRLCGTHLLP